jgi:23S rRNA pseudouridine1911/1915/1917 synthase
VVRFISAEGDVNERVDVVLARRAQAPRAAAQAALRSGAVTVSGRPVRPSYRLASGDQIEGSIPLLGPPRPEPEDIAVPVRYEDGRVMVVSKPAGLVTHPAGGHPRGTLVNALVGLGVALSRPESARPGIVHRLDKDTSGLLLVAKDDDAHGALERALRRREVTRRYLALVTGRPPFATGTIDAPVGRHPRRRRAMAVVGTGRRAVTHLRVLGPEPAGPGPALVELSLETGRTHQIRVHLAHIGSPVLGDRLYGGATEAAARLGLSRPFLHAHVLAWPHPDDGRRVEVVDKLPDDLAAVAARAGIRVPEVSSET